MANEIKVRIYKVGHGNLITIDQKRRQILFDGGSLDSVRQCVDYGFKPLIRPTDIIFSHFHKDHYNYLVNVDCSRLENIIYPNTTSSQNLNSEVIDQSILDRIVMLIREQNVSLYCFLENSIPNFLDGFGYRGINLYRGLCRRPHQLPSIDERNDSGLIIVANDIKKMVLPGDCSYYSWPNVPDLDIGKLDYLVTPHHGGGVVVDINDPRKNNKINLIVTSEVSFTGTSGNQKIKNGIHEHYLFTRGIGSTNNYFVVNQRNGLEVDLHNQNIKVTPF